MEQRLGTFRNPPKADALWSLMNESSAQIMVNNVLCILLAVAREGGRNCFILTLLHNGKKYECFCRCAS
jgi:hypothetical protein